MKRFSKKSVAYVLVTILLFSFVFFNVAYAEDKPAGFWSSFAKFADVGAGITNFVGFKIWQAVLGIINSILAAILMIVGSLFDLSIDLSISKFSTFFSDGTSSNPIVLIWGLIRDVINIVLIFILLYIAIAKIVGSLGVKAKTTLVYVVLSALFINFSMFITRVVIDIGNMFAVALYNQIVSSSNGTDSISMKLIQVLHFGDFFSKNTVSLVGQGNMLTMQVLQIALTGVFIWALFSVSILFIGRAVMLIFLIISSPIGFIGSSIPWVSDKAKEWKESLINQVLVAPIFMFLLLVVLKVVALIPEITKNSSSDDKKIDVTSYFTYIFIMLFLVKSVEITKKYSGDVAKAMSTAMKVAGTAALVAVTGGAAMAGGIMTGVGAIARSTTLGTTSRFGAVGRFAGRITKGTASGLTALGNGTTSALNSNALTRNLVARPASWGVRNATSLIRGRNADGVSLGDDKSLMGKSLNFLRTKSLGTIKKTTDVDIEKLEKTLEKASKDAATNIEKQAERIGPQKDIEKKEQIENIIGNRDDEVGGTIGGQADYQMLHGTPEDLDKINKKNQKTKEFNEKEEAKKVATNAAKVANEALNAATVNLNNVLLEEQRTKKTVTGPDGTKFEIQTDPEATRKVQDARDRLDKTEKEKKQKDTEKTTADQEYNTVKQELEDTSKVVRDRKNIIGEEIAGNMGVDINKLRQDSKDLESVILQKIEERNKFITELASKDGGLLNVNRYAKFGIFSQKEAEKLANKLRAQKGKYKSDDDFKKQFEDFVKKQGLIPPPPAPTTPPKL